MSARKFRFVNLIIVILLSITLVTPALADKPLILEETEYYDHTWYSCADFDVQVVGVQVMKAKVKFTDDFGILRNNAQTAFEEKIINAETGKYLISRAQWTWNMFFEDNYSTKSILAGSLWRITTPDGGVVWQDNGVEKYVGIYVDFSTGEIIFVNPYHVAGQKPDYLYLADTICEALK